MKKYLINSLIILGIFVVTSSATVLSILIREGEWGMPKGLGVLIVFIFLFGIVSFSLSKFESRISRIGVVVPVVLSLCLMILPKVLSSSSTYFIKVSPFYITIVLGILSGYFYYIKDHGKFKSPLILGVFPLIMALGTYDLWVHRIEYGNWTGEVAEQQVAPFELKDKAGNLVNNESLKGKVVLFDFWFVSCGPCWVKFPDLQALYEKYQDNPNLAVYAVNRPMRWDKPGELYSSIEEKGYSFPVLEGTQDVMKALDIYKYPTVMIIYPNGEMVFMGELKDAEKKLESMLAL